MPKLQPSFDAAAYDADRAAAASPPPALGEITALGVEIAWADSPARLMHERLLESFAPARPRATENRFPMLGRLTVIAGGSILLWAAIGFGIAAALG